MSKKDKILEKDRKYVWHPFTQMKEYEKKDHILIERGEGVYLIDSDGNKYYDTISSWWVNIHGHNNKKIKKAIKKQMNKIEHVNFSGFTHIPAVKLAEAIIQLMPEKLNKIFYSDNGSTAVEIALKTSFQYWKNIGKSKKKLFICFDNGYHGDTIGAVSVGGVDLFHGIYKPLLFKTHRSPSPDCLKCSFNTPEGKCNFECIKDLEAFIDVKHDTIAGMVIEPMIQAAGGMIFHKAEFLVKLREITEKYGIHLILDEVATGFGRTGKMWAMEHAEITPDFVAISKGITGGYLPLAATITKEEIFNAFYDDDRNKTFFHGHTYTANPIACAAAIANLKIFRKENVLERVAEKSKYLSEKMKEFEIFREISNVRTLGMVAAMDVKNDMENIGIERRIYEEGFNDGLVLRPLRGVLYFFLPLSITEEEISDIIERTKRVIAKVIGEKGIVGESVIGNI